MGLLIMVKRRTWGQERGRLGMLVQSRMIVHRPLEDQPLLSCGEMG